MHFLEIAVLFHFLLLNSPDYEKPFKLIIDSSDVGTGAVLVQEASDELDHPVIYLKKS